MAKKKLQKESVNITEENTVLTEQDGELEDLPPEHDERVKIRRQQVFKLWIEGHSVSEMSRKLEYATRTIERDLTEIKKERAKYVDSIIHKFDINAFVGKQLREIERRRQIMWETLEKSITPQAQVRISQELRDLNVEEENLYRRLSIKTMQGKPEDLINQNKIAIFTGAPPAGYKLPEEFNKPKDKPNETTPDGV